MLLASSCCIYASLVFNWLTISSEQSFVKIVSIIVCSIKCIIARPWSTPRELVGGLSVNRPKNWGMCLSIDGSHPVILENLIPQVPTADRVWPVVHTSPTYQFTWHTLWSARNVYAKLQYIQVMFLCAFTSLLLCRFVLNRSEMHHYISFSSKSHVRHYQIAIFCTHFPACSTY